MKTHKNYFSALPLFPTLSCSIFVLLIYKTFLFEIITQNPLIWKTIVPIVIVLSGVILSITFILAKQKSEKKISFAPYSAMITSALTVLLGLTTPYRINILTSYKNLLIQTMDIITGVLSGLLFALILSFASVTVFCCISDILKENIQTKGEKTVNAIFFLLTAIAVSVALFIENKIGCANTLLVLGCTGFAIGLLYTIIIKIKSKH